MPFQIEKTFVVRASAQADWKCLTSPPAGSAAPPAREAGGHAAAAPLDILSLGAGAATRAAARSARRPQVWIALAILVVLALWHFIRARS